jgi:hypothetical protein
MVSLAEGFRELGVEYAGTADYWLEPGRNKYLINRAVEPFDAGVHIYNTYYFIAFPDAIQEIDYSKVNVLIDREDGLYGEYCNPKYKRFDLILRTHYNGNINYSHYHPNIQPWAFGLSQRIMNAVDAERAVKVEDRAYISFRLAHDLRSRAVARISPVLSKKYQVFDKITNDIHVNNPELFSEADKLYWEQSGHRHDPVYYKNLDSSLLSFAFGGFIHIRPFATNRLVRQFQRFYRLKAVLLERAGLSSSSCYFIDQFDSWRLWESLYSNSCPIHMDFADWNWVLPVMPENKVHYWGVKRFEFEESAEELLGMHKDDILQIGHNGAQWSGQHYSPAAVAGRLLKRVEGL